MKNDSIHSQLGEIKSLFIILKTKLSPESKKTIEEKINQLETTTEETERTKLLQELYALITPEYVKHREVAQDELWKELENMEEYNTY